MVEISCGSCDDLTNRVNFFEPVEKLKMIKYSKGTNPGGVYIDSQGRELYVKRYSDPVQSACEFIANKIYAIGGVSVLHGDLIRDREKIAYITPYQRDFSNLSPDRRHLAKEIFVLSAFLLDWDAVGTGPENPYGNLQQNSNGKFFLVDHGGALLYRGLSGRKPSASLSFNYVPELRTLRTSINPRAQAIFGTISDLEIKNQIESLINRVSDDSIRIIIKASMLGDESKFVEQLLISRKNFLHSQL